MARSPLTDAVIKWDRRAAQARQLGIGSDVLTPLAKYDLGKVMQGGSGMSDAEANLALVSAAAGKPIIQDPKPKTGLLDILGNVGPDVTGIVKGFVPGLAKFAWHLPSNIEHSAQAFTDPQYAKAHGYEPHGTDPFSAHDWAAALRNVARLPASPLLPGAHTAAALTTGQGREQLKGHPAGMALDVLPFAGAVGKIATLGRELEPGSAAEALATNRPLKALSRTIPTGSGKTLSDRLSLIAQKYNIDAVTKNLARGRNIITRQATLDQSKMLAEIGQRVGKWDEETWQQFYDLPTGVEAARGGKMYDPTDPAIPAEQHAAILEIRKIGEEQAQKGYQAGTMLAVPIDGKMYPYPITATVAKRYQSVVKLGEKITQTTDYTKIAKLQQRLVQEQKKFVKSIHADPPAALHDFIEERVRTKATERLQTDENLRSIYQGQSIEAFARDIQESTSWQDMAGVIGTKNFYAILHSSINESLELAKNGFDPLWLHHVPVNRYEKLMTIKPLYEHYKKTEMIKSRSLNFAPHYHNANFALIDAAREQVGADASRHFVDQYLYPQSESVATLKTQARDALRGEYEGDPEGFRIALQDQLESKYTAYDPTGPFTWKRLSVARDTDRAVLKYVANGIDAMFGTDRKLEVQGSWDKAMKVFRFSVLTGPRHIVHVAVGGMMMMMGRHPEALLEIRNAARAVREKTIPANVPHSLYDLEGEHLWEVAKGKTISRVLMSIPNGMKRFEEYAANLERSAVYLSQIKRGADVETAALEASKTFVTLDDMVPMERVIAKNIMPFYAFTRHLFRYLLSYPADYPVRAAILARFAEQEQEEWKSGLPQKMQQLFFLGSGPDVTGVDFKAVNPFRSFGNDFSLTGFISGLNPVAQVGLQMFGVNPVSATPELYPQVSYDTQTGTLQAKRPHSGDWPGVVLETFIPPTQALDHFIGITDRMRNLKKNPEAFRRQLFSALNLPFDVAEVNLPLAREKTAIARYQAAQRATGEAMKTGDWTEASRYNLVPFRGRLTSPQQSQAVWEQLARALGLEGTGISPKAVIPPQKKGRGR